MKNVAVQIQSCTTPSCKIPAVCWQQRELLKLFLKTSEVSLSWSLRAIISVLQPSISSAPDLSSLSWSHAECVSLSHTDIPTALFPANSSCLGHYSTSFRLENGNNVLLTAFRALQQSPSHTLKCYQFTINFSRLSFKSFKLPWLHFQASLQYNFLLDHYSAAQQGSLFSVSRQKAFFNVSSRL